MAREAGFEIEMLYISGGISGGVFNNCLKRVIARGFAYGIRVYDNSRPGEIPKLVLEAIYGQIVFLLEQTPNWLDAAGLTR